MKKRRFWFHYNKPESKKQGRTVLTVHWKGSCIQVNSIKCHALTETHERKRQPHCVVRGWAHEVKVCEHGKALIHDRSLLRISKEGYDY